MSDSRIPGTRGHMRSDSRAEAGRLIMPQTCKRRPGRGGAAVHSLVGDEQHHSRFPLQHPDFDLSASEYAAAWLAQQFRVPQRLAGCIVSLAGLGGQAR
jgi:hypothetical protein